MSDANLYSDTFFIEEIDNFKYDRVTRLFCFTDNKETEIKLDVNNELFPCAKGERLQVLLASTLSIDGIKDDGKGWREVGRGDATLADEYDYVCHGKVYRFDEGTGDRLQVFVSFGGLLLYIEGPFKNLSTLRQEHVYLCLKK